MQNLNRTLARCSRPASQSRLLQQPRRWLPRVLHVSVSLNSMTTLSRAVSAQPASSQALGTTFTLEQALQFALDHYPTVRAALEQVNASGANVTVAKAAYLPHLDSLWQTNRATAN